ncbi:hypothetical protein Salat_2810200 [Sesamum alatum]|uniref:Uncharacterized protein n=1 Tax=Sesamum alatum TaxID=300844 RepID=A0AAE2C9E9_9LAMI|nr:hypothetical protein Salat_2810200 [Sesamum alatum]
MQIFNLRKEFELLKIKEAENVKEYIDRVMKVVNRIRLMGEDLPEKRIVEKVMVTLPERFEAKISSLEDTWDLSQLTLQDLANALQAIEQRKAFREEENSTESALVASHKTKAHADDAKKGSHSKKGKQKKFYQNNKGNNRRGKFPPCPHYKKTNEKSLSKQCKQPKSSSACLSQ